MDFGRGRKTHRPRAIPGWRLKTDFDGRAVNDAATSETLGLPLEEARVLRQASREINRILGRSALSGRCRHASNEKTHCDGDGKNAMVLLMMLDTMAPCVHEWVLGRYRASSNRSS
jgi:hypothetical protein